MRGQHIMLANDIRLTPLALHGQQVTLGIEAPPERALRRGKDLRRKEVISPDGPEGDLSSAVPRRKKSSGVP